MLHPRDYSVNEMWIVFRLNDTPVETEQDGDFNVVCLMDAASCYILGNEFVPARMAEIPKSVAERLIATGRARANVLPQKLLLSSEFGSAQFAQLAKRSGMKSKRVPDNELTAFLSEARDGFREHIGGSRLQ